MKYNVWFELYSNLYIGIGKDMLIYEIELLSYEIAYEIELLSLKSFLSSKYLY